MSFLFCFLFCPSSSTIQNIGCSSKIGKKKSIILYVWAWQLYARNMHYESLHDSIDDMHR